MRPSPGSVGTVIMPSASIVSGSVTSWLKNREDELVSPITVNPGSDASAMLAARPIPVSTMPPHHTGTPRLSATSWIAFALR